jgi:hypothetical protein
VVSEHDGWNNDRVSANVCVFWEIGDDLRDVMIFQITDLFGEKNGGFSD